MFTIRICWPWTFGNYMNRLPAGCFFFLQRVRWAEHVAHYFGCFLLVLHQSFGNVFFFRVHNVNLESLEGRWRVQSLTIAKSIKWKMMRLYHFFVFSLLRYRLISMYHLSTPPNFFVLCSLLDEGWTLNINMLIFFTIISRESLL